MQKITCEEILKATKGVLVSGDLSSSFTNISIDTRTIEKGDLFIPIKGERFDGHDFIQDAFKAGAIAALSSREIDCKGSETVIQVADTTKALGDLASYYRQKFNIPFIAVTGSVGKTSTKDMIASVLSQKYNVLKTSGNFNNEIGLPLTIFKLDSFHEAAVIEMGMSGFGEISRLTRIVKPDICVITNVGMAHIEKLGSRQNILKAKMEIMEGLREDGLIILNGDDNLLIGLKDLLKFRTVYYGLEDGLTYQASNIKPQGEMGTRFEITIGNSDYSVNIQVPGVHHVFNALAAIAVGLELKIPIQKIICGINDFVAGKMRLNVIHHEGLTIIDDVYNASPQSMFAALSVLKDVGIGKRKIAILGDMLEMGEWAPKAHNEVGKYAQNKGIDAIISVGKFACDIVQGAIEEGALHTNVFSFDNNKKALDFLKKFTKEGDAILVKGSRGMKMEQIVAGLTITK